MNTSVLVLILIFPVIAAIGMVAFMAGGKGKPAATQDDIIAAKRKKQAENQSSE